ncbi:MAG TPA: hypothetical protein VNF68_01665 [Candidatus Baltobacteraceae bacterium]|nr:hypothetical protein [Candidatus Baltobacteraceae bacterium]
MAAGARARGAVIAISLIQQFVIGYGLAGIFQGDVLDRILGVVVLVMGLTLIFADIDAVVNDDDTWWLLLPRAFSNSIRAAWTGSTMVRVIGLFLAQYALQQLGLAVRFELQSMHVADAVFWATIPLDALLLVPFGIVTVLVYFDAIGYESTRACSE